MNVPVVLVGFVLFVASQTLMLGTLMDPPVHATLRHIVILWIGTVIHGLLFLILAMLSFGLVANCVTKGARAVLWSLLLIGSTFLAWDFVGYDLVRQHLFNAMRLLWQNVFLDIQIMRSRTGPLLLVVAGYLITLAGCLMLFYRKETKWPVLAWKVPGRSLVIASIVLFGLAVTSQLAGAKFLPSRVYRASLQSNISVVGLVRRDTPPADSLFYLRAPKFRPPPRLDDVSLTIKSNGRGVPKPDIFFFVIESLRRDCTTAEVTPHLHAFSKKCLEIQKTVANANQTHYSMSAIVHGMNPFFHGTYFYRSGYRGAVPIRVLKKLGYRIRVLAAPDLAYFTFAKGTFGKDLELADEYLDQKEILKRGYKDSGEIDGFIVRQFAERIAKEPREGPAFYFVVLDSSHIDYFWGNEFKPRFFPYCEKVRVVPVGFDPAKIEPLRNRYKNSVAYVDELMGRALSAMEDRGLLDRSIVVVTGDHGEEFLERGHVAHGAEPNHFQLEVPILIHLPGSLGVGQKYSIASHVDIFPTIFDLLNVEGEFRKILSGRSLIGSSPPAWAICVQQFGSSIPTTLVIDRGDRKLLIELMAGERIGRSFVAEYAVGTRLVDGSDDELVTPSRNGSPGKVPAEFVPALKELIAYP